jgi:hypothetical protein
VRMGVADQVKKILGTPPGSSRCQSGIGLQNRKT